MTPKQRYNFFVAACDENGGIYSVAMSEEGKLSIYGKTPCDRPMYLAREGDLIYCLLRAPFEGSDFSGVSTYRMGDDGKLTRFGGIESTCGVCGCHISVQNGEVYAVNYLSGNVVKIPSAVSEHCGRGTNSPRQDMPHTHMVDFAPDGNVIVSDLGLDSLFVYDKDLNFISGAQVPSGHGARHFVFSNDGSVLYCANELECTVSVFTYGGGKLKIANTFDALPSKDKKGTTAAAIRLSADGKYLYVSQRGEDVITCFGVHGTELTLLSNTPCGGAGPRDFILCGDYIVCTNERDNTVTSLRVDGASLTLADKLCDIPGALCVIGAEKCTDCIKRK